MAKVMGIGGVFVKCADPEATKAWYMRVLGMSPEEHGAFLFAHSESAAALGPGAMTVFSGFSEGTDYFDPSPFPIMINLMVDDLDGVLERAESEGVAQVQPRQDYKYGRFAWVMDPDGRKIELWQPPS